MDLMLPTLNSAFNCSLASADPETVMRSDPPGKDTTETPPRDYSGHWKVLLGEFIHLLALFCLHSRTAGTARASEVLFQQLLQHLRILSKMPNHSGDVLVRRVHQQLRAHSAPDYVVIFGNLLINSQEEGRSLANRQYPHLKSVLGRACEGFAEQDIHSLLLRLPGRSSEDVDRLRFSLHILTRYNIAAKDGNSIALRYYGRSLVVPVISDLDGKPDPNLTLMAALNGLSTVNARELIRQAQAYAKMDLSESMDEDGAPTNCYNQIFKVRSLRAQIIRPPVEINNLLSPYRMPVPKRVTSSGTTLAVASRAAAPPLAEETDQGDESSQDFQGAIRREKLVDILGTEDSFVKSALDGLFADDYADLDLTAIGNRFMSLSRLIYAVGKKSQDPAVMSGISAILQDRLKGIADEVLANIVTRRQGLKIASQGQSVLVGMVHPRLFDLITLIKEHVVARQRMVIIKEIAFTVDPCHINLLADGFGITVSDAHQIFRLLQGCFSATGRFIRTIFESRVDAMSRHENVIFEILWCFLRQTPQRNDRLNFLNAIQLLMARLSDPKRALQFLMADICLNPAMVSYTDRNAFALANVLLHKENKELYIDVQRTPEDVLKMTRPQNQTVHRYAAWRLEVDHRRFLRKMQSIAKHIRLVVEAPPAANPLPFEMGFLLALEREALIFYALVQGHTARQFIRETFDRYNNLDGPFYKADSVRSYLPLLIPHLQIVVRALGLVGNHEDTERLTSLEHRAKMLSDLDTHPAHGLRVRQMMKWIPLALSAIQSNSIRL